MREQKIYYLSFAKEEKKSESCSITLASYAKEIAGDVFAMMAAESFMEKIHEYIGKEESKKEEEKREKDSKKKGDVDPDGKDMGLLPVFMKQTTNSGQIQV